MFDFLELSKNTISHDGIDSMVYEGILHQSPELRSIKEQGCQIVKTFPYLQEDVFYSLYKPWPELLTQEKISPECSFNRQEIEKLIEAPSYKELRQYTQLDEFGAGLGSKALLEELCSRLKDDKSFQEAVDKINQASEHKQKAEELKEALDNMQNTENDANPKNTEKLKNEINQSLQSAQELSAKAEQLMAGSQSQLRRAISAAAEKAVNECEETDSILTAWGFNQGQFQQLPFEKKMEIARVLRTQKKFQDMTKLVGRMRNLAIASRKAKLDHMRVELHSITTGDDISRALTQELAALRKPTLKLNFYRKLYEKQLLQYDLTYRDKAGRGPIICLIDSSGSMAGQRDEWAKAVSIGLLEIALKERRAFAYAVFSSAGDNLITDTFLPGERSPEKILKMVTSFYGGGTNFEKPLRWAMETIKETSFNKADIVMITDGECRISDVFLKELLNLKQQKEFAVYSVLIGFNSYSLEHWSDQVWKATDLLDNTLPEQLYQSV